MYADPMRRRECNRLAQRRRRASMDPERAWEEKQRQAARMRIARCHARQGDFALLRRVPPRRIESWWPEDRRMSKPSPGGDAPPPSIPPEEYLPRSTSSVPTAGEPEETSLEPDGRANFRGALAHLTKRLTFGLTARRQKPPPGGAAAQLRERLERANESALGRGTAESVTLTLLGMAGYYDLSRNKAMETARMLVQRNGRATPGMLWHVLKDLSRDDSIRSMGAVLRTRLPKLLSADWQSALSKGYREAQVDAG